MQRITFFFYTLLLLFTLPYTTHANETPAPQTHLLNAISNTSHTSPDTSSAYALGFIIGYDQWDIKGSFGNWESTPQNFSSSLHNPFLWPNTTYYTPNNIQTSNQQEFSTLKFNDTSPHNDHPRPYVKLYVFDTDTYSEPDADTNGAEIIVGTQFTF